MYWPMVGPERVEVQLKRRGYTIERRGDKLDVLPPLEFDQFAGDLINKFREFYGRASFRKLVRQITSGGGSATLEQLVQTAGGRVDEYVGLLQQLGVAELTNGTVVLTRHIDNVGPTLEWYVADVLKTDYEGSSEWSVKLTGGRYGDYDVLGWLPPTLVYVETKSSDPRDVSDGELKNFLQRGVELVPELAILMVDTDDDLEQAGCITT